ncbi:MAG TPA: MATE family efflux transporter [Candidatus Ornithospirochaeta stercorigallinarum]|nr:MATE family efflux transporter [Candidatus Ornithospirochaeta stercorigallinarum]
MMQKDLTEGPIVRRLLLFSLPMTAANLLQQCYNLADTMIVGRFIGDDALASVGSAYTLMVFITSILLGLSLGSSALIANYYGAGESEKMHTTIASSFIVIFLLSIIITAVSIFALDWIIGILNTPEELEGMLREYLFWIFLGLAGVFLTNYFSCLLRSVGDSVTPLIFLSLSAVMNIFLDLYFIISLGWGIAGAAIATIISQYSAGFGLLIVTVARNGNLIPSLDEIRKWRKEIRSVLSYSFLTSAQQSVMNFGILMVQGLVNSFGVSVMAAFAAGVKIDSFSYLPTQDFGNAYSFFISQNSGKGQRDRIRKGTRIAVLITVMFSLCISLLVNITAPWLIGIFFSNPGNEIISIGVSYLRVEGSFYALIGMLFLFYGYFRADGRPSVSLILTIISLGLRVLLSYTFAPLLGYWAIWVSIPIGWAVADLAGLFFYKRNTRKF